MAENKQDKTDAFLAELEKDLTTEEDLLKLSANECFNLLESRSEEIIHKGELRQRLIDSKESGKPLVVKYGIDPTGEDIHLGHATPVIVLRRLQKMSHKIIFLIGDFTAFVGDPTGRIKTRPVLSDEDIKKNVEVFKVQVGQILDVSKAEIRFNSEWLDKMSMRRFFDILRRQSTALASSRKDFRKRGSVTKAEFLYSTLMAIDSLELMPDLELGGADQLINFQETDQVMSSMGVKVQCAITNPVLLGIRGKKKMSNSLGNFISLRDTPEDVYGKTMSVPDSILENWFKLLTEINDEQWRKMSSFMKSGKLNPRDAKMLLARLVVFLVHGSLETAREAEGNFVSLIQKSELPDKIPTVKIGFPCQIVELLRQTEIAKSNSDARRLIDGGGIQLIRGLSKEKVFDLKLQLQKSDLPLIVQKGKRVFVRIETDR